MVQKAVKIFTCLQKQNPQPATELVYANQFELLIAVILSAQATDIRVNKVTKELFKQANTPEQILALGQRRLKNYIKTVGLYNTKANNIFKASELLIAKYNSILPNTRTALESLPGVGRKTANVILNEAFGIPTIAVDTHVLRVANRLGLATGKRPLQIEQQLDRVTPTKFKRYAHNWLILHGRYVCLAKRPKCAGCVIMRLCNYARQNLDYLP
jgi:endonuclease-3